MNKHDSLAQFAALRSAIEKERADLTDRLARIEEVLGLSGAGSVARREPIPEASVTPAIAKAPPRLQQALTLREAVTKTLSKQPLTKAEILDGVSKLGYRFEAQDPMNSLNVMLYKSKEFKKQGKQWTLQQAPPAAPGTPTTPGKPKRRLSAAGRARIIAAAKARWAKQKAAGKK